MNPLHPVAFDIAGRVMREEDAQSFGIDPTLVLVIIKILAELAPMVTRCLDDDDDAAESVAKFVSYRGIGWRWRQMRLRHVIRQECELEYGRDVPTGLVVDLEREIMKAGSNPEYARVFARVS